MRNNKFWDECNEGSLREAIAIFIDSSPLLSKFTGEKYYKLEDSLAEFIESNKDLISNEVKREQLRENAKNIIEYKNGKYSKILFGAISIEALDSLIYNWQESLACDSDYCDTNDDALCSEIDQLGIFNGVEDFSDDNIITYAAYLQDWFTQHRNMHNQSPACIKEFFDCEMQDDELKSYYEKLAKVFKAKLPKEA